MTTTTIAAKTSPFPRKISYLLDYRPLTTIDTGESDDFDNTDDRDRALKDKVP